MNGEGAKLPQAVGHEVLVEWDELDQWTSYYTITARGRWKLAARRE